MSSRNGKVGAAIFALTIGAMARLGTGCSDDTSTAGRSDAAVDAPINNVPTTVPADGATRTCREDCELGYPSGRSKDQAIGSCWQTHCSAACIEQTPANDAGSPDAGTCSQPVVTPSDDCDTCTRAFCCAEWDGCFGDEACSALNACYQTCNE